MNTINVDDEDDNYYDDDFYNDDFSEIDEINKRKNEKKKEIKNTIKKVKMSKKLNKKEKPLSETQNRPISGLISDKSFLIRGVALNCDTFPILENYCLKFSNLLLLQR